MRRYTSKNFLVLSLTRLLIGWFRSSLRGISRAVFASGGSFPNAWNAVRAASM